MNHNALKMFQEMSERSTDPSAIKFSCGTKFLPYDISFLLPYCTSQTNLLDLGSGSGKIVNQLVSHVASITCLEPTSWRNYIVKDPKVTLVAQPIQDCCFDKQYDLITAFGLFNYFLEAEAACLYPKIRSFCQPNGTLIIKNQFGIHETVTIDGYREDIKQTYFSQYRTLEKEKELLANAGFGSFQVVDIYPKEANIWKNTHFYALVCHPSEKK